MKYVTLQVQSSQIILPQLRCSGFFVVFCLITFLFAVNYTFLTKNFGSIIGFCDRTTYKAVIKVTDSYLFIQKFIFGSSELVHVCWIFRWFFNTFGLIFLSPSSKMPKCGRKEDQSCLCISVNLTIILDNVYWVFELFPF